MDIHVNSFADIHMYIHVPVHCNSEITLELESILYAEVLCCVLYGYMLHSVIIFVRNLIYWYMYYIDMTEVYGYLRLSVSISLIKHLRLLASGCLQYALDTKCTETMGIVA